MPDKHRDEEHLPPIPDGGLTESMPEWLRRPPAWRTLSDAEVSQPEPKRSGELPEADTSVIDPRTFLADDDLPEWLRRFGASARSIESVPGTETERPSGEGAAEVDAGRRAATPVSSPRFTPRVPVAIRASDEKGTPAAQEHRPAATSQVTAGRPMRGTVHRAAWWQGPQLTILLAVALLIALIVIAALVV